VVVLGDAFADFDSRRPNYRIEVGVVVGFAAKNLDAEGPLLQRIGVAFQCSLDDKPQQIG